jgi:hypothetical protein
VKPHQQYIDKLNDEALALLVDEIDRNENDTRPTPNLDILMQQFPDAGRGVPIAVLIVAARRWRQQLRREYGGWRRGGQ